MAYDLLLRGARVIDSTQELDGIRDIAIRDGRIAAIAEHINERASTTIDLSGKLLTAGFIDIHAHLYPGSTTWGIRADALYLSTGVTTAVDAGSAGWANLQGYLDHIVAPSRTQFLAFVHICGIGLTYGPLPELADMRYADPERTAFVIEHFAEHCVGVKVRQGEGQVENNGVEPLRLAVQAAEWAEVPVMVHIGRGVPLPDVLELLRPRDIVTHCYQGTGDGILDGDNNLIAEALQARQQGILFDVGHGGGSFDYGIAERAVAQGFVSDVISTDLHAHSWDSPIESLPETASKLLNLGVPLASVVQQCTAAAASAIGREDELGTLKTGTVADLAAFDILEGEFEFTDVRGRVEKGRQKLVAALTVRNGTPYYPADLYAEMDEDRQRAFFNKKLNGKNLKALGWHKG
jgi:dihydroorotase